MKKLILIIFIISCAGEVFSQQWVIYPEWNVKEMIIDSTNTKWFATYYKGLVRLKGNEWTVWDTTNSPLTDNYIRSIAKDKTNNIWVATWNKGIFKFDGVNWTMYYYTNIGYTLKYISRIRVDDDNTLWACSYTLGLLKHIRNDKWIRYYKDNSGIPENSVTDVKFEGNIKWIGTKIGGIARFDDTNWKVFNTNNTPLLDNGIESVGIDIFNNKWFSTTYGGVAKFNTEQNQWTIYTSENSGLPWNNTWAIYIDDKNKKWIGLQGGGFVTFNDTTWDYILPSTGSVWDFKKDKYGNMWICWNGGLRVYNPNGVIGIRNYTEEIPSNLELYQNYPNPFNPVTKINFAIPKQGYVNLKVYDILGREVKTLINEIKQAGYYSVDFNASNLSSGVYFYKIQVNEFMDIKKMIVIK